MFHLAMPVKEGLRARFDSHERKLVASHSPCATFKKAHFLLGRIVPLDLIQV